MSLSRKLHSRVRIQHAAQRADAPKHRPIAFVELVTTAGLALSTAIAATAVSIGIARADVIGAATSGDSAPFAIALFIGLLFSAMGALTAMLAPARRRD
jgi:hypothetical protein